MRIRSQTEVDIILGLNGTNVGIVALVAELTIRVPRSISTHTCCVFGHCGCVPSGPLPTCWHHLTPARFQPIIRKCAMVAERQSQHVFADPSCLQRLLEIHLSAVGQLQLPHIRSLKYLQNCIEPAFWLGSSRCPMEYPGEWFGPIDRQYYTSIDEICQQQYS